MTALAIIGGTGVERLTHLELVDTHHLDTPYGKPSRAIQEGRLGNTPVFFLHRHGAPATIPPHLINYRANLWALHSLGARDVVAINAVGGISAAMQPGQLLIPDQIIDYTWGRQHSFDDGRDGQLLHIDFSEPYDPSLRQQLMQAADHAGIELVRQAVHGVAQGPRLETAAEVRRQAADGCDVIGMTGMPEASLARELGLAYAAVCMVVNRAAGLTSEALTLTAMHNVMQAKTALIDRLLSCLAARYGIACLSDV
ncbi:MAG: S-methyl-5'-thioinosine phosphorylase [Parahaliea sp.]